MARKSPAEIGALRALAGDPAAQAEKAVALLQPRNGLATVQAAVDILIRHPQPESKPALLELYAYYTERETSDPACYVRSQILLALRPLAVPADLSFFWAAAETYAFPPPQFTEEGGLLRANALLVLSELDDEAARYAATRLLVDEHTAAMSGEPAVTAAQVLTGLDELLPLYLYVMQPAARIVPEVGAQALRGLVGLPEMMFDQVVAHYTQPETALSGPVQAGLFELLLGREPVPPAGRAYLWAFLRGNSPLELYRYLVTLLVTCNTETGWSLFEDVAQVEDVPRRVDILRQALSIAPDTRRAEKAGKKLAK
jgi:hypothetical protein